MLHPLRGQLTPREGAGPLPALHGALLQATRPQRAEKEERSLMRMITSLVRSLGNLFGSRRRALGAGVLLGLVVIVPTFALMMQTDEAAGADAVSKIAFYSAPDGDTFDIYTMNPDGSGVTQLTTAGSEFAPAWSPDGSKIAFQSHRDGNTEIYAMNANGSGQTNLTNSPGHDEYPDWSPDGSKIAFHSAPDGDTFDIYTINPDGSGVTQLTTTGTERFPVWSPDGSKIAFESQRDGNAEIYVMNANGSGQTNLTNGPGQDEFPDWGVSAAAPPDTTNPTVGTVAPTNGATGVSRATNVVATFSEAMDSTTLSKTNVKLYKVTSKGTTEITNVTVAPSADGTSATLNPYGTSSTVLEKNTTYQALVSTGARDLAGNALDQSKAAAGN